MSETFEYYRDNFFLDPRDPDGREYAAAAGAIANGIISPNRGEPSELPDGPLREVTGEIIADYQRARVFDHRSVAQLHPAGNMVAGLAHFASTIRNNNTIVGRVSPVETGYEVDGIEWMLENIAGYDPAKASGSLVFGGTSANQTALLVARERLRVRDGWDARTPAKLFASSMAHYSVSKSAFILGPGGLIETDKVPLEPGGYRMDPKALRERVQAARRAGQPIMGIVAVAGETETGDVDDLAAIVEIAQEHDIYLHIDGAYGAPYRLSRQGHLFAAVPHANSLTYDPHKYGYVPYNCGAIMFGDAEEHALLKAMNADGGDYMFKSDEGALQAFDQFVNNSTHLGDKRIEGSMGGQAAAALHFTIKALGREGLGRLLDHNLDVAEAFAEAMLGHPELQPAFYPDLNTVCIEPNVEIRRNNPGVYDQKMEYISRELERRHGIYLDTTALPERHPDLNPDTGDKQNTYKVLRFVSTNPYTSIEDAREIAKAVREI